MKKLETRVSDVEEYAELPDLDELLTEGKPIETKEVLFLIKSIQKDIHMKFVSDSKLMPVHKSIEDLTNKMNDLQIAIAQKGGDPTGASLGQEAMPIIIQPQIITGKVEAGRGSSMSGSGGAGRV